MVYANDRALQMPVADLYDTQMMAMAINAAKDMYEKGLQLIKDFNKEYGDFLSPIQKDMDWYNKNVTQPVRDTVNNLYKNGIDPLRSAEGRALINKLVNSIDTGTVNKMRQSAATKKLYDTAAAKMGGKYNKSFSDWDFARKHGGIRPEDWSTVENGIFEDPTPIEFQSLRDLTLDSYKNRTPRTLTKEDFDSDPRLMNYKFDPRYEYTGYLDSDLMKVAPGASLSLAGNPNAEYFREIAKQKVIASGMLPTEQNVELQFQKDIADANAWALVDPKREADLFALDNARTANDIYAHNINKKTDHYYYGLEHSVDETPNIFRRAEDLADRIKKGFIGEHTQYEMSELYYQKIDPTIQARMTLVKDKDSGETIPQYTFRRSDLRKGGSFGYLGNDRKMHNLRLTELSAEGEYRFIGDGNIRASKVGTYEDGTPKYKYWISGTLQNENGVVNYNGNDVFWMPVKERDYNYGQTQKKK